MYNLEANPYFEGLKHPFYRCSYKKIRCQSKPFSSESVVLDPSLHGARCNEANKKKHLDVSEKIRANLHLQSGNYIGQAIIGRLC